MKYIFKDSVGTLASLANFFTTGTYPTLFITGGTINSLTFDIARQETFAAVFLGTTTTGTAQAFTAGSGLPLTSAGYTWTLGQVGQVSTTGTLPAGLSASTNYFVVPVNGSQFNLATTYANAVAGTVIAITSAGVPTNTFTPTAIAGSAVVQLQSSNDNVNWINQGTAGTMTIGTALGLSIDRPLYHFLRFQITGITAGQVTFNSQIITKSDVYQ